MSVQTQLVALKAAVDNVITVVPPALQKKVVSAFAASNALLLGGKTWAEVLTASRATATTHINSRNTHGTTAAQVGGYTTAQVDAAVSTLLAAEHVPISRYGAPGTVIAPTLSGFDLNLKEVTCFLAGKYALLPAQTLSFSGYASGTNYLYLEVVNGALTYVIRTSKIRDSLTQMFLGTVVTSASAITSHTLTHLSRLDVCRMVTNTDGTLGLVQEI